MTRISTIIPTYNRADLIGETLRSILSQDRSPDEVIVVDDGSTDGTPDLVAEQFGSSVSLVRQKNSGAGAARNNGFAHSTGDIIHFMDSDDLASLNTYASQAALIERGAEIVYGPWLKTKFNGSQLDAEPVAVQQRPFPHTRIDIAVLTLQWVTVFQPCLFRRSLIEAAGPYRTDLATSEDTEMLYRMLSKNPKMVHSSDTVLLYRVHPEGQVSEQNLPKRLEDRVNIYRLFSKSACSRVDLYKCERRELAVRRTELTLEMANYDPVAAQRISGYGELVSKPSYMLEKIEKRLCGKLTSLLYGHRYTPLFGAAPVTQHQIREIKRLGYDFAR